MKIRIITLCLILLSSTAFAQDNLQLDLSYNSHLLKQQVANYQSSIKPVTLSAYPQSSFERKSVGKALLFSLLIPGAGEYYLGETGYTKFFFGMEIVGWSAILFNRHYYNSLQKDYMAYASVHADIDKSNKDDQFWIDVGKHDNIFSYNNTRVNERRIEELYEENDVNYWRWDSKDNRYTYDAKRLKSVNVKDREIFMTIGIVVNHLVSAVNAVRLARRHNKNLARNSLKYHFVFDADRPDNKYIGLALSKSF